MVMAKDGEVAHSFQPLMGVSRSFFWGLMEAKWPIRRSRPEIPAKMKFEDIGEHGSMIHGVISWNASRYGQYCGHILGCLLINDAVIAKGFVLWTGFVQTLPIG